MKILAKIMFDGSCFCGFQVQPGKPTVQAELCRAFSELFSMKCDVTGCSRTDSGVHANGFCAAVTPSDKEIIANEWCTIPPERIHRAVNVILPDCVSVAECAVVDDDFHPRYDVESKEYVYKISDTPHRNPFYNKRVYELGHPISDGMIALMQQTAEMFLGAHDFKGFMASGSKITDTVRTVKAVRVWRDYDGLVCFSVSADGFLYNMVRIMTGTLLSVAAGRLTVESVQKAIDTGDRRLAGFTAPPEGLYLNKVNYGKSVNWTCI